MSTTAHAAPAQGAAAFAAGKRVRDEQMLAKADELEKFANENADIATERDSLGLDSDRAWTTHHQQVQFAKWLRQAVAS
ncbi:hypothetical protein [Demequina globuliformis]|uniref:hypothetical protein n=1 Tax=Demequina globuliformis TaxID=676202 RepID=UPI000783976C|nr:hypothetical protein [Demequina globuliformis]